MSTTVIVKKKWVITKSENNICNTLRNNDLNIFKKLNILKNVLGSVEKYNNNNK